MHSVRGAFHDHIEGLDALRRHAALGRDRSAGAINVHRDQDVELSVVMVLLPFVGGATLRPPTQARREL